MLPNFFPPFSPWNINTYTQRRDRLHSYQMLVVGRVYLYHAVRDVHVSIVRMPPISFPWASAASTCLSVGCTSFVFRVMTNGASYRQQLFSLSTRRAVSFQAQENHKIAMCMLRIPEADNNRNHVFRHSHFVMKGPEFRLQNESFSKLPFNRESNK